MPIVLALIEYWGSHPPTHIIQAAKAGIKQKSGGKGGPPRGRELDANNPPPPPKELGPPRELTDEEFIEESKLPKMVREIRAAQREERKRRWLQRTQTQSKSK